MAQVAGFRVAGVHCGLKKNNALDFALIVSDRPCTAAGVFTINHMKAAPVIFDMALLAKNNQSIRAVAVNTRCANACTGELGLQNAGMMARLTADAVGCDAEDVLVMSTGVIGTHLNMDAIQNGVNLASAQLGDHWEQAAEAIMTTDTRPKFAQQEVQLSRGKVTVAGIAKGAGMIAPNMATMLSVITTDASVDAVLLQSMLSEIGEQTFNRIVIDGDMSTNDTVLLLANGASGMAVTTDEDIAEFRDALFSVARELSQAIVRDGEGVTKFITLQIEGAASDEQAKQIANTIATSPLVKTAFYGGDANWGRIVAAAGRSGATLVPENIRLWIKPGLDATDGLLLFENAMPTSYAEAEATDIMTASEIAVRLDCGIGHGSATVWTCDLSHDYVSINGHYRT